MNEDINATLEISESNEESFDFDELEKRLEADLEEQMSDIEILKEEHDKIANPDTLGETVMNVVWEQFINQIGVIAGKDFITENKGLSLELRNSAHIQTSENFADGKIATHNTKIDYQERYNSWQSKLDHDENGKVKTHSTRTGKIELNLASGARKTFDQGRPTGSSEKHTDMDHTVSAGEIIRNPRVNAHLSQEEQIAFANSEFNLNEMDLSLNRSKGDLTMTDWLDKPNKNGQRPSEIFDISEDKDKQLREKDKKARTEYKKRKEEGEQRSIETGKQSQKEEAFRIGGKALRSVIMGLLAELIKNVIQKLITWIRSGKKSLSTFIDHLKEAIKKFISKFKQNLYTAGNTFLTTIATAILGPIIGMLKKAWVFLKQGWKSFKEAINYIKDPNNKNKPFSILMLEVGKIVIAGLTVGGAILLGEVIEKGLMGIPIFAFEIPFLGSLASLLGLFFGALVSGIIGAIALNLIDKVVASKQKEINIQQQITKMNDILSTQDKVFFVAVEHLNKNKLDMSNIIMQRHKVAEDVIRQSVSSILCNDQNSKDQRTKNDDKLDKMFDDLNDL